VSYSDYSPAVLQRVVVAGGSFGSFKVAADVFTRLTDLVVTDRTVRNKTIAIGGELAKARAAMTDAHLARPLTGPPHVAQPAVSLAVAQVDGGRMQTRTRGCSVGVHDPHWRESKKAGFYRMTGKRFDEDPHRKLPSCFTNPKQMAGLLEKFWNDGDSGDAILHLRAALISDGTELSDHMATRPGRHYTRRSKNSTQRAMT
jgi:hypothetical protein